MPGDMRLARKAGMLAVGRLTGSNAEVLVGAGAHYLITNLTELETLLRAPTPQAVPPCASICDQAI
jgi:phosphoglycolate phosphatase-like HAD superfamily hydrolase